MIFEVHYKRKKDADNRQGAFHIEFFESATLPDKTTVANKLGETRKDFAESTLRIFETQRNATRVTKL